MNSVVQIATRKSPLALWQALTTQKLLVDLGLNAEIFPVVTTGDKMQKSQLADVHLNSDGQNHLNTGKGLFIKEIQEALLNGQAQVAVHSMKDLPVTQTNGLSIVSVLPRAGARDFLILSPMVIEQLGLDKKSDSDLKKLPFQELKALLLSSSKFCENVIGTTSSRRQMLFRKYIKKDLNLQILRGNVDSRLKRLRNNEFAAIVLAEAGLERLGLLSNSDMFPLPLETFIPATAQGVIAVEIADTNEDLKEQIAQLCCHKTALYAAVERLVLFLLDGDCHSSIGIHLNEYSLFIICARDGKSCETKIILNKKDMDQLKIIFEKNQFIYSSFFKELCSSVFAQKIHSILLKNNFAEVSEVNSIKF
ncbi:hydroxymethylbilane synthase [Fluviispira multicolorata]|uniref:hydroxymethylbilane synthase n=1 Tax=Fluviispira multicolorata TaxID=2654512 RepID=A0A833JEJ8_9BACT|nr:hydroxymethylbilane synthase [Fluviispira multicolorata]KAB8033240.1 hydroxymethylbilane synthase [Fluviispira multicolorata]